MICKRSSCLVISLLLLLPALACAAPILDPLPADIPTSLLPPPILPQFPPDPVIPALPSHPTPDPSAHLRGVRYLLKMFPPQAATSQEATEVDSEASSEMQTRDSAFLAALNMSVDSAQDVEPSVIAINKNGQIWTTTVYTKITYNAARTQVLSIRNWFSTTSDFATVQKGELPMPAGYNFAGDPYLAANPFPNGVAPGRVYASGVVLNATPIPDAIAVWRSDDGGRTWSSPSLAVIENDPSFPNRDVDKPALAVSWHSGSLGHVYVVYVRTVDSNKEIRIAKSTDGGISFFSPTPVPIASGGLQHGPQVVVNPFHGHVYVLWTDYNTSTIKMATSMDFGQTWTPETVASINTLYLEGLNNTTGPRAPSFPIARFNPIANRISVVWHEREQSSSQNTDVYYISKSDSGGWQPAKVRINDVQANDQFFPALDADTTGNGNLIVTFYDRRDDPTNWSYQLFSARIDPKGNRLEPNQLASSFQSDPRAYPGSFIGDYHETWSQLSSGTYYYLPASVGILGGNGDIYVSAITPVAGFLTCLLHTGRTSTSPTSSRRVTCSAAAEGISARPR